MPACASRVGNRDIYDAMSVGVKDFARVAGDGRVEESVDEFAADEKRMAVLAVVFRRDGPDAAASARSKRIRGATLE